MMRVRWNKGGRLKVKNGRRYLRLRMCRLRNCRLSGRYVRRPSVGKR